jgi:SAM-dependent methyltransferase
LHALLRCPRCRAGLAAEPSGDAPQQLACVGCGASYPIDSGIPRFVPGDQYAASFGRQWTRYDVAIETEDEATFEIKTGVRLGELSGLRVLDAGCGGGRYSRVAARYGARVVSVDLSRAVDRAMALCRGHGDVCGVQASLNQLPLAPESFDLAFSIGVLHHSHDAPGAFRQVAAAVRPGGRLAVWLYRRNTWPQEAINHLLRALARHMTFRQLEAAAVAAAVLGSVPILNRTLNKLVNFSNHPVWENRVCDTFDWYSPRYQSHHTLAELADWFREAGFTDLRELPPAKSGQIYRWAYEHNLIIGSGVNMVGVKHSAT